MLRNSAGSAVWVCAGRPDFGLARSFQGADHPFPDGLPPLREQDVRSLLLERLSRGRARQRLLERDQEVRDGFRNRFLEKLVERSGGVPIYLNYAVGDLLSGRLTPDREDQLPKGIDAYHERLLSRYAIGDLQAAVTPIVTLLALADDPLSVEQCACLLDEAGVLSTLDVRLVGRAVETVQSLLRRAAGDDEGLTLYHPSLREHILESNDLVSTVARIRHAIADAICNWAEPRVYPVRAFLLRRGLEDVVACHGAGAAAELMSDPDYIDSFCALGEGDYHWYRRLTDSVRLVDPLLGGTPTRDQEARMEPRVQAWTTLFHQPSPDAPYSWSWGTFIAESLDDHRQAIQAALCSAPSDRAYQLAIRDLLAFVYWARGHFMLGDTNVATDLVVAFVEAAGVAGETPFLQELLMVESPTQEFQMRMSMPFGLSDDSYDRDALVNEEHVRNAVERALESARRR